MNIQNRIIGSGTVNLDSVLFNPKNWRIHPKYQQDSLDAVLENVGWVQNVIVNNTTGNLIDGHLRCQLAKRRGETEIPAVFVELSEEEENLILASIDPIAGMAATDREKLQELISEIATEDEKIQKMLDDIAGKQKEPDIDEIPEQFMILVECSDEFQQMDLLERLTAEGVMCKALIS